MAKGIEEKIVETLHGVPDSWGRYEELFKAFQDLLPEIEPGYKASMTTFLLHMLDIYGMTNSFLYTKPLLTQAHLDKFATLLPKLKAEAEIVATTDQSNCSAEMNAFGGPEVCVFEPRLSISYLYRYLTAQSNSMGVLIIDTDIQERAIKQIRRNPYSYFMYGDTALMPIRWEDI